MKSLARNITDRAQRQRNAEHFLSFSFALSEVLEQARKSRAVVSLGLVDIDWFGKINASHGPTVGDGIIACLEMHLAHTLGTDATVKRYGGDAFGAIFPATEKEDAFLRIEAARDAFDKSHVVEADGQRVELSLSISAGLATHPDDAADDTLLIRKANEALYRAKVGGRNKVCLAREEKMVTKTSHYAQGQLHGLSRLAKRKGIGEAELLREALDDLLRKHNA